MMSNYFYTFKLVIYFCFSILNLIKGYWKINKQYFIRDAIIYN